MPTVLASEIREDSIVNFGGQEYQLIGFATNAFGESILRLMSISLAITPRILVTVIIPGNTPIELVR